MTTAQFTSAHLAAQTDQERKQLEDQYTTALLNASATEQRAIILSIDDFVSETKIRLMEAKDFNDSVVTVKDYCKQRNVSRQYVYQEIKSGKFKTVELPVFTEYKGKRVAVGTQKFLSF